MELINLQAILKDLVPGFQSMHLEHHSLRTGNLTLTSLLTLILQLTHSLASQILFPICLRVLRFFGTWPKTTVTRLDDDQYSHGILEWSGLVAGITTVAGQPELLP